ncbi:VWA domain-containing protein [Bremerella cremea]|uniref:VWA domain-containing protein n=1 Tax=Bremerella cremea TaxID=1031537 RepID=A0A368KS26_9BACT|nr:BatA domain-containing protein [Bremerella cremea]RCS46428.1 VWA domain-containing protein [Bremerella cremea]
MSVLSGIFLLGAAAIAAPILFHLIRRTPKAHYEFSSLMFLKPSPPKLTRRSRLDQWLLLLLRSLVILLLAIAFMRPYFRSESQLSPEDSPQRHIAILIDQSASMRRGNLWQQAIEQAKSTVDALEPTDEVSLFGFGETLQTIVTPEDTGQLTRSQRRELVRDKLDELEPTWGASNLGTALLSVAERLEAADDLRQTHAALQIVLIGDVQSGSQLDALQTSQWPKSVRLAVRTLVTAPESNARVRLLARGDDAVDQTYVPRVRVRNVAGAQTEQFDVAWSNGTTDLPRTVTFYVPPGESLVLDVPYDVGEAKPDRLQLRGDGEGMEFDNTFYVVPPRQEQIQIAYFGSEADDDPAEMLFYLSRAFGETPARKVEVNAYDAQSVPQWEFDAGPRFVVISQTLTPPQQKVMERYLSHGGHALVVLKNDEMAREMSEWLGGISLAESTDNAAAKPEDYAMLGHIDFRHPLFVPFAAARYNDFTKIRFWRHRRVNLEGVDNPNVIAQFEDRSPALWSTTRGAGKLYVMTAGWNCNDSQLALSTKFLPLLSRWLELAARGQLASQSYVVNQAVPLPVSTGGRRVRLPDGATVELVESATQFTETSAPGIYTLLHDKQETPFAVNLADAESETDSLPQERLEQLGIVLGTTPTQAEQLEQMRQLRDIELESRQKIWKWLIVAVLILLGIETLLAARRTYQPATELGDLA